jgi:diguanylate cyclase (GGDEF)-like protein/putative nucleotidyltransferase with HDIG domain
MRKNNIVATLYSALILALGCGVLISGLSSFRSEDPLRFVSYFLIALLAAGMRVSVPSQSGNLSLNFIFIAIGLLELSLGETLLLAAGTTAVQQLLHPTGARNTPAYLQVASVCVATYAAALAFAAPWMIGANAAYPLRLVAAALAFFITHSVPFAAVTVLGERGGLGTVWRAGYLWSFTYYILGAWMAGLFSVLNQYVPWQVSMVLIFVVYLVYRSYAVFLGKIEDEKRHAEEMAELHLRTIEALALAIEAKDHTTHDHLQRVQVYALEIGRDLGMNSDEIEALRAGSILHDIGKLAVPEHIISKPGRLTPEEFEKMKIHPVVGAEILERVKFPYDVAPIVRSHHEKWDGTGYPDGLSAEQIPLGARILAAVDCLDALATDRQYRRALPLDKALDVVVQEAGKSFDPRVVDVLRRRYRELEAKAQKLGQHSLKLSHDIKIANGEAPAAGFEQSASLTDKPAADFLASIAAARQEMQALYEITQDMGSTLSFEETMSLLAVRLKRIVPYDSLAVYIRRGDKLIPEYVCGENYRLFSSLEIPMGQGLSGWVAENRKAILNGNPSVEPGYLNDPQRFSTLRSAIAVPLEASEGVLGVLALYHSEKDAFVRDHLRVLLAVGPKSALAIENAIKFRQVESSATTDYLTALPNARSLFLHLDSELARCRRSQNPLTVLVCDLDGFKSINDNYGHLEGNKVLKAVARGFREACREYDYVARMGGDEFVLVLPGLTGDDIDAKMRRLSQIAARVGQEVCGTDSLAASVGHAVFPDDGRDAEMLLAEADRRMYKAKQEQKQGPRSLPAGLDWQTAALH